MPNLLITNASASLIESLKLILCSDWEIRAAEASTSAYGLQLDTPPVNASKHLCALGVRTNLSGYHCLLASIQQFSRTPTYLLKEIYPEVSKQCGLNDALCVEHVIRTALQDAWANRNEDVWKRYFPNHNRCPTNKEFITKISEML